MNTDVMALILKILDIGKRLQGVFLDPDNWTVNYEGAQDVVDVDHGIEFHRLPGTPWLSFEFSESQQRAKHELRISRTFGKKETCVSLDKTACIPEMVKARVDAQGMDVKVELNANFKLDNQPKYFTATGLFPASDFGFLLKELPRIK